MIRPLARLALLLVLPLAAILPSCARGQARYDVYVLAIGVSNYVTPADTRVHGLSAIDGAGKSARYVAETLVGGGAREALLLTAPAGAYVSLANIEAGLAALQQRMTAEGPARPLLIVYFAGHGMAEGIGWNHFSIPGDFAYAGDPASLAPDALAAHTLYAASLADELDKLRIPYLMLLDTCSEGSPARFDSPVLSSQASGSLASVAQVLRAVNEFRQESPVIFSAAPGDVVSVVADPTDPDPRADAVAPLARRLLLVLNPAAQAGRALTLGDLVRELTRPNLDAATTPGVTHATPGPTWDGIVFQPGAPPGTMVRASGDATTPDICCQAVSDSGTVASGAGRPMRGALILDGPAGEFITGGRSLTLETPAHTLSLTETNGAVSLEVGDTDWELDLSGPGGQPLAPGDYPGAQRDGFQDHGHPGLAVTGDGHACNSVAGVFQVQSLTRDARGQIMQLSATFRQLCDDNPAPLTGSVNVNAAP
jgi:hypothetical protein